MRKTLTIDDDVAAELERQRAERGVRLKDVVNDALRRGMREMQSKPRKPYEIKVFDVGEPLIKSIDCIGELLAIAEGEDYK